jgi:hypothetical protein
VHRQVTVDDPRVASDTLVHEDGRQFVWLVSQSDEELAVKPALATGLTLAGLDGNPVDGAVTLPPFGVGVYQLLGTQSSGAA